MQSLPPTSISVNSKGRKKKCGLCRKNKGIGAFHARNKEKGWINWACKRCDADRGREARARPGRGEKIRAYYRRKTVEINGKMYTRNGARYVMMRDFIITMYGAKCECCEEQRNEFLCMDHTEGGGGKHRRELRGESVYSFLYKNRAKRFPWMRVLCLNCNGAKAYRGYCPHERERARLRP